MIFKMIRICFEINVGLTSSTHHRNNWALSLTHNECRFVLNKKKKNIERIYNDERNYR